MPDSATTLTKKQEDLLADLLAGSSVEQAAIKLNIARRTAFRWVREPVFHARYVAARREMFDESLLALMTGTNRALAVILKTMTDETVTPGTRLRAAQIWLEQAIEIHKFAALEQQVAELEQMAPHAAARGGWKDMLS